MDKTQISLLPSVEEAKPRAFTDQAQIARNALAAEHMVCVDLLRRGHDAFIVAGYHPYDILVHWEGSIKKIQVKSKGWPSVGGRYQFGMNQKPASRRKGRGLPQGLLAYKDKVDALALVAVDIKRILYLPTTRPAVETILILAKDFEAQEQLSWDQLSQAWSGVPALKVVY